MVKKKQKQKPVKKVCKKCNNEFKTIKPKKEICNFCFYKMKREINSADLAFNFSFKKIPFCAACFEYLNEKPFIFIKMYSPRNWQYNNVKVCIDCLMNKIKENDKYLKQGGYELWLKEKMAEKLMSANATKKK